MSLKKKYWNIRRKFLKHFVPEFIWPKQSVIDGVSFKIRGTPYSYGTKKALQSGNYEVSERQLLQNKIKPGDVVIEMGGSIGILTAIMADKVGKNGLVVSIEASEKITGCSKIWLEKMGNTKVITGLGFPVFLLDKKINIKSFDEQSGSLGGRLLFDVENEMAENVDEGIFDIKTIMQLFNVPPTVLVIDVEGSERILTNIKPCYPASIKIILMEMHVYMYGEAVRNQIIQRIVDEGFQIADENHGVYLFERN